jgi:ferredoxin
MTIAVERDQCVGSAYCRRIAPGVFDVDDHGIAYVVDAEPREAALAAARKAMESCPSLSIYESDEEVNGGGRA